MVPAGNKAKRLFSVDHTKKTIHQIIICLRRQNPAGNCMFKVNNRDTRKRCEICIKLTIMTPERRH